MYLKEIGKVPLLSAEEEIELAKNMEAGAVAKEKIAILKSREEKATEEELAEIKEEIKNLQKDLDAGDEMCIRDRKEAVRFHADAIGTEHILIAMIKETDCVASRLLTTLSVNMQKVFVDTCLLYTSRCV